MSLPSGNSCQRFQNPLFLFERADSENVPALRRLRPFIPVGPTRNQKLLPLLFHPDACLHGLLLQRNVAPLARMYRPETEGWRNCDGLEEIRPLANADAVGQRSLREQPVER